MRYADRTRNDKIRPGAPFFMPKQSYNPNAFDVATRCRMAAASAGMTAFGQYYQPPFIRIQDL
jgi:hypothetical protein